MGNLERRFLLRLQSGFDRLGGFWTSTWLLWRIGLLTLVQGHYSKSFHSVLLGNWNVLRLRSMEWWPIRLHHVWRNWSERCWYLPKKRCVQIYALHIWIRRFFNDPPDCHFGKSFVYCRFSKSMILNPNRKIVYWYPKRNNIGINFDHLLIFHF